jgi:hypothetical protein
MLSRTGYSLSTNERDVLLWAKLRPVTQLAPLTFVNRVLPLTLYGPASLLGLL